MSELVKIDDHDVVVSRKSLRLLAASGGLARGTLLRALERIAEERVPDQPASNDIDEAVWIMRHVGKLRRLAQEAIDEYKKVGGL